MFFPGIKLPPWALSCSAYGDFGGDEENSEILRDAASLNLRRRFDVPNRHASVISVKKMIRFVLNIVLINESSGETV